MTIQRFHQNIVDKLDTITQIKDVAYSYLNLPTAYPAACVRFIGVDSEYDSTTLSEYTYHYEIQIEQLIRRGDDRNVVYKDFETLVDSIETTFGNNSIPEATRTTPTASISYEENVDIQKLIGTISVDVVLKKRSGMQPIYS